MSQKMIQALKKRVGDNLGLSPPAKRSKGGETPSKEKTPVDEVIDLSEERHVVDRLAEKVLKSKRSRGGSSDGSEQVKTPSTIVALCTKVGKGKDMLQHYLTRSLPEVSDQLSRGDNELSLELVLGGVLKEVTQRDVDWAKKETKDTRSQLKVMRKELREVNKKLFAANTKVDELTKELQDMPSTTQLEADNVSLSQEVNSLKDERESLRILLTKLEEDVKNKQTREEELVKEVGDKKSRVEELEKEVDVLETAALEVFYEF
uniref:Uncharacterized protein n=1 Tax=Cannabis sativa TaxID=3483 RepID=A0A803PHI3_CANSA